MFSTFLSFFFKYIFKAKTRQKLLIMAMSGLALSSFSLLVVQSALKGLQNNRIERSKEVQGSYVINKGDALEVKNLEEWLKKEKVLYSKEYLLEGLIRKSEYIAPVILHGLDAQTYIPGFLEQKISKGEILLSPYLADKVYANIADEIQIVSPIHTDAFFGELPRFKTLSVNRYINTREPEMDEVHAWVNIRAIQSLIRKKEFNKYRIYQTLNTKQLEELSLITQNLQTWEKLNSTLVYALSLENNVIVFLFMGTIVLVVITIASGLSIFYARVKTDFASFWILGMPIQKIRKMGLVNISVITILSLSLGNILALVFLQILKVYSPVIMPEMFVDRSLPILITGESFIFSLFIPSLVTLIFTYASNARFFNKRKDFLKLIRSVGR